MRTRGDKVLLGFFAFGVLFYLLALLLKGDSPVNSGPDSVTPAIEDSTLPSPADNAKQPGKHSLLSYTFMEERATQFKLPKYLREISGLAMTADNRLLAHNDEQAIVFEIDHLSGDVVKAFGLGGTRNAVADDFEGIAIANTHIYMVSSSGRLYEFGEGEDRETVAFKLYTTGVGQRNEIRRPGLRFNAANAVTSEQKSQKP